METEKFECKKLNASSMSISTCIARQEKNKIYNSYYPICKNCLKGKINYYNYPDIVSKLVGKDIIQEKITIIRSRRRRKDETQSYDTDPRTERETSISKSKKGNGFEIPW